MKEPILDFFEPTKQKQSSRTSIKAILILIIGVLYIITPMLPLLYQPIQTEEIIFILFIIFGFGFSSILISIIGYALTKIVLRKASKFLEFFKLDLISNILQAVLKILSLTLFGFLFNTTLFIYLLHDVLSKHF
jgi:hypothetical protein